MKQKITRQILSLILTLVCVLNMGITVFADEEYDSGMTKEEVIEKYSADTGNKQADEVFNKYLEKFSEIMVDEKYAALISSCESLDSLYEEFYITYGEGTHEEWSDMTTFEKQLNFDLYITPMFGIAQYSYDSAFGTLDIFLNKVCRDVYRMYEQVDVEFSEAYYEIMEWQYYYIIENNAVYNFMTGEDSLGNTEIAEANQEAKEEADAKDQEYMEEAWNELDDEEKEEVSQEIQKEKTTENSGNVDNESSSFDNIVIIGIILVVLVVAFVAVILYRKSKTGDNTKSV